MYYFRTIGYQTYTAILLLAFATLFSPISHAKTSTNAPIKVTILVDDSYPPYAYVNDGYLFGVYVELVKKAARKLSPDYQVEIRPIPWKRGLSAIENGDEFAIMPPYIHVNKRPYIWPYSVALAEEVVVATCDPSVTLENILQRDTSLPPVNVGINTGFLIFNKALNDATDSGKIKVWENKDTRLNIMKLLRKRIDCYVNDRLSTQLGFMHLKRTELPELDIDYFREDQVIVRRTAHIGYVKDSEDKYPFKNDFVSKMDQALLEVLAEHNLHK